MPDIAMCTNNECPKKDSCYRFKAEANPYWQAYSEFVVDEDGNCDYFMEMK